MQYAPDPPKARLLVACLCASWCETCGNYRPGFQQLQTLFPAERFVWIDIEDLADLVDPIEVENFPTLLIAQDHEPLFFGTLTPHMETLQRLLASCLGEARPPTPTIDGIHALTQRLQRHFRDHAP